MLPQPSKELAKVLSQVQALVHQEIAIEIYYHLVVLRELRVCVRIFEDKSSVELFQELVKDEISHGGGDILALEYLLLNVLSDVLVLVGESPAVQHM